MSQPDPPGPEESPVETAVGAATEAVGAATEAAGAATTALADAGTVALDDAKRAAAGAGDRIRTEVDTRSSDAGQHLERVAGDLRTVADGLTERGSEQPAKLAAEAARQSHRLGAYLKESDADRLMTDAEDLMRRQPAAFAAGAALAGFVAARFLKASAQRRSMQRAAQVVEPR